MRNTRVRRRTSTTNLPRRRTRDLSLITSRSAGSRDDLLSPSHTHTCTRARVHAHESRRLVFNINTRSYTTVPSGHEKEERDLSLPVIYYYFFFYEYFKIFYDFYLFRFFFFFSPDDSFLLLRKHLSVLSYEPHRNPVLYFTTTKRSFPYLYIVSSFDCLLHNSRVTRRIDVT